MLSDEAGQADGRDESAYNQTGGTPIYRQAQRVSPGAGTARQQGDVTGPAALKQTEVGQPKDRKERDRYHVPPQGLGRGMLQTRPCADPAPAGPQAACRHNVNGDGLGQHCQCNGGPVSDCQPRVVPSFAAKQQQKGQQAEAYAKGVSPGFGIEMDKHVGAADQQSRDQAGWPYAASRKFATVPAELLAHDQPCQHHADCPRQQRGQAVEPLGALETDEVEIERVETVVVRAHPGPDLNCRGERFDDADAPDLVQPEFLQRGGDAKRCEACDREDRGNGPTRDGQASGFVGITSTGCFVVWIWDIRLF